MPWQRLSACGKPVLLADKVNIAEDIAEDGAGLMELDTADGTLRLLQRWIGMTVAERQRMGELAYQCFHRRYDMRENAKAIIRLFGTATVHTPTAVEVGIGLNARCQNRFTTTRRNISRPTQRRIRIFGLRFRFATG